MNVTPSHTMHDEINPRDKHIGLMSNYKRDPLTEKITEGKRMAIVMTTSGRHTTTRGRRPSMPSTDRHKPSMRISQ
ncbi:hypothetical protein [Porphyromonas cangingivalis]|uniref:hypothetical protein n=1 Tax=Porphyromonas cangingivalis TaxID=36874 RepID=UPI0006864021|nr:hypothetical protein [Porphyromonas cangingivalis]